MLGDIFAIASYLKMIVFLGLSDSGTGINTDLPWNYFKASTDWNSGVIQGFNPCHSWTIFKVIFISSLSLSLSLSLLLVIFLVLLANVFAWYCSHGLRTGIFEASKLVLINVAPTLPDIQVMVFLNWLGITEFSIVSNFLFVLYVPWILFDKNRNFW